MSFKQADLYPCNPATTRGEATRLSVHKDKLVYANGRTVIIRDLKNQSPVITYAEHVRNVNVARISPTGYYCATGDIGGTVRIWDIVGEDKVLKGEYRPISGAIKDLEWDGDSKRIIAVGDGKEKYGHAFMMDSGSSSGEIIGHSKVVNAVAIRHQRPFRAATAGDDATIVFHHGVPFKFDRTIKTHSKFVQDVKYAPSGDHFASVGSDAKIFLYDGKTGDTLAELTDSSHTGSIMAVNWSPDSKSFATVSLDRTVKIWDAETRKAVTTWTVGAGVDNQQVGGAWTEGDEIISLSMSGNINIFDKRTADTPSRILQGPSKPITAAAPLSNSTFVAGVGDGRILSFSGSEYTYVEGTAHSTVVAGIAVASDGKVFSAGLDDKVREITPDGSSFVQNLFETASQPKSIATAPDGTVFVAEVNGVEAIRANQLVFELKPKFTPSAVAVSGTTVAVGGEDQKVRLYDWDGKALKETGILENNKGIVTALAFSPDGSLLAAGDSNGKIPLYDVKERKLVMTAWSFHSGRVLSLAWTKDGRHCASGALDTHVYVWSVAKPMKNVAIKNAAAGSINSVFWLDDAKLASAGADGIVKIWNVTFHA